MRSKRFVLCLHHSADDLTSSVPVTADVGTISHHLLYVLHKNKTAVTPLACVVPAASGAPFGSECFSAGLCARPPHVSPPAAPVLLPRTSLRRPAKSKSHSSAPNDTQGPLERDITLLKASTSWARVFRLRAVLLILSFSLSSSSLSLPRVSFSCVTVTSFCFSSAVRSFRSACSCKQSQEILCVQYVQKNEYIYLKMEQEFSIVLTCLLKADLCQTDEGALSPLDEAADLPFSSLLPLFLLSVEVGPLSCQPPSLLRTTLHHGLLLFQQCALSRRRHTRWNHVEPVV